MILGPEAFTGVNIWGVLAASVVTMVIGFLWYSPLLFAGPWARLMGYDLNDQSRIAEMRKGAGKMYAITFVATIFSAVVLAKIIDLTSVVTIVYGMKVGFFLWLGFVATVQLTGALFGKQPTKLFLINTGYQLVCYVSMGAILARWPHP